MKLTYLIAPPSKGNALGTTGVEMRQNPLSLGSTRLAGATNVSFHEGVIRTRPGIRYHRLNVSGVMQGATTYRPSKGLSVQSFAPNQTGLALVVSGAAYIADATSVGISCVRKICGSPDYCNLGPVWLFQAENYLVFQNVLSNTYHWDGFTCMVKSPGMWGCEQIVTSNCGMVTIGNPDDEEERPPFSPVISGGYATTVSQGSLTSVTSVTSVISTVPVFPEGVIPLGDCFEDQTLKVEGGRACDNVAFSSHDSFCELRHKNWLVSAAGLGIYAHGRIHQESERAIFVSDLVHKRGYLTTSDILLMEEQALESMGDPLTTPSRLGKLKALGLLPNMTNVNGEGDLVAYYEDGVVTFNTFFTPRETRRDGDGAIIQKGWAVTRLVNHLLNTISAVGRYAVASMPRDQVFRSIFGLHYLRLVVGNATAKPEPLDTFSMSVEPILNEDPKYLLDGAAVGVWQDQHRIMASTGLFYDENLSELPMSRGFVVFNQAATFTASETPRPLAEGLWTFDPDVAGMTQFLNPEGFGFVGCDRDSDWFFGRLDSALKYDLRDEGVIPIEWEVVTGSYWESPTRLVTVSEGMLEIYLEPDSKVQVFVRSDLAPEWSLWDSFEADHETGQVLVLHPLGQPPREHRTATWFQFRVRGLGYAEVISLAASFSQGESKDGKRKQILVDNPSPDYYLFNTQPRDERWTD